jgi:hypothetical protein
MLNRQSIDELGITSILQCLFPQWHTLRYKRLRKKMKIFHSQNITNTHDRELYIATVRKYKQHRKSRVNCAECKANLATHGYVCDKHFHDYCTCNEDYCLPCLLLRSARSAYPDDPKWYD